MADDDLRRRVLDHSLRHGLDSAALALLRSPETLELVTRDLVERPDCYVGQILDRVEALRFEEAVWVFNRFLCRQG